MFSNQANFAQAYRKQFETDLGKQFEDTGKLDRYTVLVKLVADEIAKNRAKTLQYYLVTEQKAVYYFSMEFLMGRLLENYLLALGIRDIVADGLASMGENIEDLLECEKDPGLGNGGLGRLAACFIDSMACLSLSGVGMGLRYRFGLFNQKIVDGCQTEEPDTWANDGYPWEVRKNESVVEVKFGGSVNGELVDGQWKYEQVGCEVVRAVPYDVPVVGYQNGIANNLRLWSAEPVQEKFDLDAFRNGDYSGAVRHRSNCEAITSILYPDDTTDAGKTLRLKQEYLLVSAGVASILRDFRKRHGADLSRLPQYVSIHTNDTHPAMCVPELMRILVDEEGMEWDTAWDITCRTISYTNHTVLPEALEKWSIDLFRPLLPRLYMMVEEIDRRYQQSFDRTVENWQEKLANTSILWGGQVRMANLSIIGSHSVNGVAALHTDILKETVLKDFYALTPEKFNNKTNGISHRRFFMEANPKLVELLTETIGTAWIANPLHLKELTKFDQDEEFLTRFMAVKHENKVRLANYIKKTSGVEVDPNSIFDIQVKRIHAYKRQLLNVFKIMALYNHLKANPDSDIAPATFIFAGKAAQSYVFAKDVIRLIHAVAEIVNNDKGIQGKIKVVFIENFNVSKAQLIYPAADISEQISTAGLEASGTGNMKFMFNGAITLGTLDGANVEIVEQAGAENACIFGLTAEEVASLKASGTYLAQQEAENNYTLRTITNQLIDGFFGNTTAYRGIYDTLFHSNDEYLVLKDFNAYLAAWCELNDLYKDQTAWAKHSLHNVAKAGHFTSDRTIAQYADEIWKTEYTPIGE